MNGREIWTIGHSTHPIGTFLDMLRSFDIQLVVDVRRFPGSRRYPQYNVAPLEGSLAENAIGLVHLEELGGRRQPLPDSPNDGWRMAQFRGYADHMSTPEFRSAFDQLKELATDKRVAYMCSEAVWWRCHRSLISDLLRSESWDVQHILGVNKSDPHPYTKPARIVDGRLVYSKA